MKQIVLFMLLAMLLTGCCSVTFSSPGSLSGIKIEGAGSEGDRMVVINEGGIYLFWRLTLATGDIRWNEKKQDINGGVAFFHDYSGVTDIFETLHMIAERENCDLANVIVQDGSNSDLQLTSYQGAAGGLVGFNSVMVSAVLRPRKGGAK